MPNTSWDEATFAILIIKSVINKLVKKSHFPIILPFLGLDLEDQLSSF